MRLEDMPLSGNVFSDMAAFDSKYGFDDVKMTPKFLAFRMRFIFEEFFEGLKAIEQNRPEDFVDAMIDVIVVAAGALSIGKVDSQRAWNEVRRANMSKVRMANPTRPGSDGADLVKPEGWSPPNHQGNVGQFAGINGKQFNRFWPHSLTILMEAMELQMSKYEDYNDGLERGDYWIHGANDLEYEMFKKTLRFRSVLRKMRAGQPPNFESLHDTLLDKINYDSFMAALLMGREPGQDLTRNIFNEPEYGNEMRARTQHECKDDMCFLKHLPGHMVEDHEKLRSMS